jgi:membrane protein DedA with SNARE-associated domain
LPDVADAIMEMAENAMDSPWIFAALFAFAALDAFFPIVPSESLVITAGVFAASGEPNLVGIILAAAAGAFVGDHISYFIGRTAGQKLMARAKPGSKKEAAWQRGHKLLEERGGAILVVCRYIPGARTAITLTSGAVAYRLRSFTFFDAIAALSWGTYSALVGYIGGEAFEESPWKGLALGLGIALSVTFAVELIRHLRRPRTAAS